MRQIDKSQSLWTAFYRWTQGLCLTNDLFFVAQITRLTRARPGVWATFARPGGGTYVPPPPANSKTTQRIDKRKKALDRS